jgi:hypothetical protein
MTMPVSPSPAFAYTAMLNRLMGRAEPAVPSPAPAEAAAPPAEPGVTRDWPRFKRPGSALDIKV